LGGIGSVIANTVVRSLTKKALGKAAESVGFVAGKKGEKSGGNKKKAPQEARTFRSLPTNSVRFRNQE
jgi:hypothetical protein